MPKSKRRPAAVAKKKAATRRIPPAVVPVEAQGPVEEIGTEPIGSITGVKRYRDQTEE